MSKAVLISIRPEYCELIASGKKTIEVRKSRPNHTTPFKCYIYCTKDSEPFMLRTFHSPVADAYRATSGGEIIGEFVCDAIQKINCVDIEGFKCYQWHDSKCDAPAWAWFLNCRACMNEKQLDDYLNSRDGYAWHITELKIYDKPKPLSVFRKPIEDLLGWNSEFKRPPQSWCYVEELT